MSEKLSEREVNVPGNSDDINVMVWESALAGKRGGADCGQV